MIMSSSLLTNNRKWLLWLVILMLFGLVMRIIFLNTPLESDDTDYFNRAFILNVDLLRSATYQLPLRLGLLLPVSLIQYFAGYTLTSYYIFTITASILLLVMVFLAGMTISGLPAGMIAGMLFTTSFYGLYQTTNLLPDIPNAVWLFTSFLLFVSAMKRNGKAYYLFITLSSLSAFLGYLVKAPNLVFLVALPIYELLERRSLRGNFVFVIGFVLFWICESLFYYAITDDFYFRLRMVLKGTTDWAKHMPEMNLRLFLLEPFLVFTQKFSGKMIMCAGLIGIMIATWKKNSILIAMGLGGFVLFFFYSYSVTSIEPLKRAMPLNPRYIVIFSAVMTVASGYAYAGIKEYLVRYFGSIVAVFDLMLLVIASLLFQLNELPSTLPDSIWNSNSYLIADQLIAEKKELVGYTGDMYATPARDFQMYPSFSNFKLKESHGKEIDGADFYLYSRNWIRTILTHNSHSLDIRQRRALEMLLMPQIGNWDYIINTTNIALVRSPRFELDSEQVVTLSGASSAGIWVQPEQVAQQVDGADLVFSYDNMPKPFYVYTFPGDFDFPPQDDFHSFSALTPGRNYEITIDYSLHRNLKSLQFVFSQYDEIRRVASEWYAIPAEAGDHIIKKYISIDKNYSKFRIFFLLDDENKNNITISKINFDILK